MSTDPTLLDHKGCDVFTPANISARMASYLGDTGTLLEPACGKGDLLSSLNLSTYSQVDVFDIKEQYLAQCPKASNIREHCTDFLMYETDKKYDNVIANPPYIRFQDLSTEYRKQLQSRWPILRKGNVDIYYAFILRCVELLDPNGIIVIITPNSYLYNKSAYALRQHLIDNKLLREIIDFGSEKVFEGIGTYCCITVIDKKDKKSFVYNGNNISYSMIDDHDIFKIRVEGESQRALLGEYCKVSNGLATLADKVFVHDKKLYGEPCWREVLSGMKSKWCIFPYSDGVLLPETEFAADNPQTYAFLRTQQAVLASRDKGKKTYPVWYAYGRTQALKIPEGKDVLYIPTLLNPRDIALCTRTATLFKNCIAIEVVNLCYSVQQIADAVQNNIELLESRCPKRGNGWLTISTTILKQIPLN